MHRAHEVGIDTRNPQAPVNRTDCKRDDNQDQRDHEDVAEHQPRPYGPEA
jgi:hypothetical protein